MCISYREFGNDTCGWKCKHPAFRLRSLSAEWPPQNFTLFFAGTKFWRDNGNTQSGSIIRASWDVARSFLDNVFFLRPAGLQKFANWWKKFWGLKSQSYTFYKIQLCDKYWPLFQLFSRLEGNTIDGYDWTPLIDTHWKVKAQKSIASLVFTRTVPHRDGRVLGTLTAS